MGYGKRIDSVVYDCDATNDFTREDWIRLALAALDQAGVSTNQLDTAHRHGSRQNRGVEGVLVELDEELPHLTTEYVPC